MEEIYQKYARTVYKYLMSLTCDSELSEELTQETFYQAVRSIGRYNEKCSMSTWLCAIAKNVLMTYRRKHPAYEDIDGLDIPAQTEGSPAEASEGRVDLFRKLHRLGEPYRETVYLRVFGGLSFREIGEVHGKTENWARVTYYRGREKLRKEIDDEQQ